MLRPGSFSRKASAEEEMSEEEKRKHTQLAIERQLRREMFAGKEEFR